MNNNQNLSIILPVYNEEKNIKNVVINIIANIKNYTNDFEIILIDDGSTDKTKDIIQELSRQYPNLRDLYHKKNKGYGAALKTGIAQAAKEWLLIIDSDGQYEINDLKAFWEQKSSCDFILGYRTKRSDGIYRTVLARLGNCIANLFLKTDVFVNDVDCGFKLFKTKELQFLPLTSHGALISFEIIKRLLENHTYFIQLPVTHYKRREGKSKYIRFIHIVEIIGEFIKLNKSSR